MSVARLESHLQSRLGQPAWLVLAAGARAGSPALPGPSLSCPQKLKAAGLGSQQLDSSWHRHLGKETATVGKIDFVPRQA